MNKKIQSSVWAFQLDKVNLFAYWDRLFTPEECAQIVKIGKKFSLEKGKVSTTNPKEDYKIRKSKISWIYPEKETQFIFEKVSKTVLNLNERFFGFDITSMSEGFQFTNYKAPGSHYGRHIDRSYDSLTRKLSVSIQLTDPSKYSGGDLLLHDGPKPIEMRKQIGDLVVFPSFVLHEVTPVTKGERNSLVCWVTGPSFK